METFIQRPGNFPEVTVVFECVLKAFGRQLSKLRGNGAQLQLESRKFLHRPLAVSWIVLHQKRVLLCRVSNRPRYRAPKAIEIGIVPDLKSGNLFIVVIEDTEIKTHLVSFLANDVYLDLDKIGM